MPIILRAVLKAVQLQSSKSVTAAGAVVRGPAHLGKVGKLPSSVAESDPVATLDTNR